MKADKKNTQPNIKSAFILSLFAVGAAEEAAAGRAGSPRGEEKAEALGRTPEQRPRERPGGRQGKRWQRPVLRVGVGVG